MFFFSVLGAAVGIGGAGGHQSANHMVKGPASTYFLAAFVLDEFVRCHGAAVAVEDGALEKTSAKRQSICICACELAFRRQWQENVK